MNVKFSQDIGIYFLIINKDNKFKFRKIGVKRDLDTIHFHKNLKCHMLFWADEH